MSTRVLGLAAALATSFVLTACGSSGGATSAQEPIEPTEFDELAAGEGDGPDVFDLYGPDPADAPAAHETESDDTASDENGPEGTEQPVGPSPWTGAFGAKAVMVARSFRIEGPTGLLEHVVASSDDALYERSVELTEEGLVQVVQRMSADVPEIRVQIDAWSIAAYERVVILERADDCPVRIIASGEAIWRDLDGHLQQADRLEFVGEIGDERTFDPTGGGIGEPAEDDQPDTDVPADDGSAADDWDLGSWDLNDDETSDDVEKGTAESSNDQSR